MAGPSPAKLLRNEHAFELFKAAYLELKMQDPYIQTKRVVVEGLADDALEAADIFHNRSSRKFEEQP